VTARALEKRGIEAVDVRDFYEERAGILEFNGGLSRSEAEAAALAETVINFGLTDVEVEEAIEAAGECER
jgi:hypothetical protein